jgi:hypothetical protein
MYYELRKAGTSVFPTQSDNSGHASWTRFPAAKKIRALSGRFLKR